ncbi:Methyltransferase domain-containing protein [Nocardioides sp. YR527]|uniref:methyltransferase domain-containing protein n=1 Tax=Nocardioides sp. YR527 TaxID=1881028 RepID=UPI00088D3E7B|nr:class I SAM-dependent methyltransferase [Nocardioides sp. YR527]SDK24862.1 Methyltransferase domain-containing protein [Nocardioides sp. YR527]
MTAVAAETAFAHAFAREECRVVSVDGRSSRLPVEDWTRTADAADLALLSHCAGPTVDLGCGPGRMTEALTARGLPSLGVDVVAEAVAQTEARGGRAVRRDLFEPLPGEGWWATALLADGNLGIGGDPLALLARVRRLLVPGGRVVAEVHPPGTPSGPLLAELVCDCGGSSQFPWAVVGADAIGSIATEVGLAVRRLEPLPHPRALPRPSAPAPLTPAGDRWVAVLVEDAA